MRKRNSNGMPARLAWLARLSLLVIAGGCASNRPSAPVAAAPTPRAAVAAVPMQPAAPIPAAGQDFPALPTYVPASQTLPIDLPTALRLAEVNNPTIALALRQVDEAALVQHQADILWIPDLRSGPDYNRYDGRLQNSNGTIATVSKQNLLLGGDAQLDWNTPEIIFGPLATARLSEAAQAGARATASNVQLDVVMAYFDLLEVRGRMAIFDEAMAEAQQLVAASESAHRAGFGKTTADINRALAELDQRRDDRFQLEGTAAVASARLVRLLLLSPNIVLRPTEARVAPIQLVRNVGDPSSLIAVAVANRPEIQQNQALAAAAATRLREARIGPFLPHLAVTYGGGEFGGGPNSQFGNFGSEGDGEIDAAWELHNLGAGDVTLAHQRQVQLDEASLAVSDIQSRVAEQVVSAIGELKAEQNSVDVAQHAVEQAFKAWTDLQQSAFGPNGAAGQFDPLQALIALRDLAQNRNEYLDVLIAYDKAQFQLYWALGQPPLAALCEANLHRPAPPAGEEIPAPQIPRSAGY